MYYDRTMPPETLVALGRSSCLAALREHVDSPWGERALAHIELRRNEKGPKRGWVQLYAGGTSLLELRAHAGGKFRVRANPAYEGGRTHFPSRQQTEDELNRLVASLGAYLRSALTPVHERYLRGEHGLHAHFVRSSRTPKSVRFTLVDKEACIGFPSQRESQRFERELRARTGANHRELDALCILPSGDIGLVELKRGDETLAVAARQAASHRLAFTRMIAEIRRRDPSYVLSDTVNRHARQKAALGLLQGRLHRATPGARLVPIVATEDERRDWVEHWQTGLAPIRAKLPDLLDFLQLWRLDAQGRVLEDARA